MKKLAIAALCFFSSFAQASEMEEMVVVARQVRIVLLAINETHHYDVFSRSWVYDAAKEKAALAKKESEYEEEEESTAT